MLCTFNSTRQLPRHQIAQVPGVIDIVFIVILGEHDVWIVK